jgi:apolipoprotein N-acyltransferase
MKHRSAEAERRVGVLWLVAGVIFLAAMLGMWWLVEETNEEGTHDAELLPFFALIPLLIGLYHLARSRLHHRPT